MAEGERVLGSSADGPIVTTAGRHELDFINTAVGYRSRQVVDIRAGQIVPMNVTMPDGRVSVNGDGEFGPSTVIDLDRGGRKVGTTDAWVAAVSPDGSRALELRETAVGLSVRLLDGGTLRPVSRSWPVEGFVQSASFSPDGRTVALGVDEEVQLRDGRTLAPREVVLGHSGARDLTDALPLARHPNAWFDCHGQGASALADLIQRVGGERVLFGSDWPFYHLASSLAKVLIVTRDDGALRHAVLRGNAERLLGLA